MRITVATLAVLLLLFCPSLHAKATIRIWVPTAMGGGTDALLRVIAQQAERILAKPVRVINGCSASRCTSGGRVSGMLSRAKADGYTVAAVWTGALAAQGSGSDDGAEPFDYIAVLQLTAAPYAICTSSTFPAESGEELLDLLRRHPNHYTYGTDGLRGGAHLAMLRIFERLGIAQRDVPFKGSGETLPAMLGGHVDIYVGSLPPVMGHVRAGRAKCQMLTSADKVDQLPDAASLRELGLEQEETLLWRGIIAPKGTPAARIQELEAAFEAAANSTATRAYVESAGEQIVIYKGDAFRQRIDDEYAQLGKLVDALKSRTPDH